MVRWMYEHDQIMRRLDVGAEVMTGVLTDLSQHPHIAPGVRQVAEVGIAAEAAVVVGTTLVESRQPNHPGSRQLVLALGVAVAVAVAVTVGRVVVTVDAGAAVVVVGSLHPNQPGVLHVVVVAVVVGDVVLVVPVSVVLPSRQPHHPGVLQVEVRVSDVVVVVEVVVVISDPLLLKNFHSSQS